MTERRSKFGRAAMIAAGLTLGGLAVDQALTFDNKDGDTTASDSAGDITKKEPEKRVGSSPRATVVDNGKRRVAVEPKPSTTVGRPEKSRDAGGGDGEPGGLDKIINKLENDLPGFKFVPISPAESELEMDKDCTIAGHCHRYEVIQEGNKKMFPMLLEISLEDGGEEYFLGPSVSPLKVSYFDRGVAVSSLDDLEKFIELKFDPKFMEKFSDWASDKITDEEAAKFLEEQGLTKYEDP